MNCNLWERKLCHGKTCTLIKVQRDMKTHKLTFLATANLHKHFKYDGRIIDVFVTALFMRSQLHI